MAAANVPRAIAMPLRIAVLAAASLEPRKSFFETPILLTQLVDLGANPAGLFAARATFHDRGRCFARPPPDSTVKVLLFKPPERVERPRIADLFERAGNSQPHHELTILRERHQTIENLCAAALAELRKFRHRAGRGDADSRRTTVRDHFARNVNRPLVTQLGHRGERMR